MELFFLLEIRGSDLRRRRLGLYSGTYNEKGLADGGEALEVVRV